MFPGTSHFHLSLDETPSRTVQPNESLQQFLRDQMDVEFSQWCGNTGQLLDAGSQPQLDDAEVRGELARSVHATGRAEIIGEDGQRLTLAIPLTTSDGDSIVAIRDFVTRRWTPDEIRCVAEQRGLDQRQLSNWAECETPWAANALLQLAETSRRLQASLQEAARHRLEAEQASITLSRTYEEISLLYSLTQQLRLSNSEHDLGEMALSWLLECLPAEAVAMVHLPPDEGTPASTQAAPEISVCGDSQISVEQLLELVAYLDLSEASGPQVATRNTTSQPDWPAPAIRQLLIAPKLGDGKVFGWIAAINHTGGDEFDSTESSLLNTVCSILGTHCGNHSLYRRQSSFLAAVVRSLTSAIDAKDPYTSGHSSRVARVAVRLGRELGCTEEELNTLYMGGLLHDIGKIGIDDNVLRKPGRLTDEEFAHIKQHPELGFKILEDIHELSDVLPIVLHHHEQWDGGGYPHGLEAEQIPWLARITAVSDSFDAMTSDRTYRKGMPLERVESIFRDGAGSQWDKEVIQAYFACRDEIQQIAHQLDDFEPHHTAQND